MSSPVVKRSIVAGHKTSVSLEDAFWKGLKDIAAARDTTLSDLVAAIDFAPGGAATCRRRSGCLCSLLSNAAGRRRRARHGRRSGSAQAHPVMVVAAATPSVLRPE